MKSSILQIDYSKPNKTIHGASLCYNLCLVIKQVVILIHHIFLSVVRYLLSKYYGEGKRVSRITDPILMESVTTLATKIRTKQIKSVAVLKAYISRIKEINPLLNCVVEDRFKDALAEAQQVDDLIESDKQTEDELAATQPLLGVPFTTKDSIQVKNMLYTAGLWVRRNERAKQDADVVQLLRKAGAIPIALTNVPELCMWWESQNTIFGRTNNPYNTSRTVGGSSGGEGGLQAAGGSSFGLGSDIGGSIRIPAIFNGIFGHKPSKFAVSNNGQFIPVSRGEHGSFLGVGPMCRYASDLKLIMKVIAADKEAELKLNQPVDLDKVKIFYQTDDGGEFLAQPVEKEILHAMQRVVSHFDDRSDEAPKHVQFKKFTESTGIWYANMKTDSDVTFEHQLANYDGKINAFAELARFLLCRSKHTLILIASAIIEKLQAQHGTEIHSKFVAKRDELLKEIQDLLGDDGVLLYPTHPTVAPYHWETHARLLNFGYTAIFNCLGLPSTAVPLGIGSEGLPLGIQVVANHNQDRLCLAVAEEIEKAFGGWVAPNK